MAHYGDMSEPDTSRGVVARYTSDADAAINQAAIRAVVAARTAQGYTQTGLSELLGWGRSKVADLENGRSRVLLADAIRLCIALDIDPAAMLNGTPEARALRAQQARRAAALFVAAAEAEGDPHPLVVANPALTDQAQTIAVNPILIVSDPAALAPVVSGEPPDDPPPPHPTAAQRARDVITDAIGEEPPE